MMILVTGGSKCGKSRYAESLFENRTEQKYYIATMQPIGDDAEEIISRHREARRNKNYITKECQRDIEKLDLPSGCGILLECIGNLCANEMYLEGKVLSPSDKIVSNIKALAENASQLVIVTNDVGSDGHNYTKDIISFVSEIAKINCKIAEFADNVIECVYGIPIALKGKLI